MAKATLGDFEVEAGSKVISALEEDRVQVQVALGAKLEEYGDWRLYLASPAFDETGTLDAYTPIASALDGKFVFAAPAIAIRPMSDSFIKNLRDTYSSPEDPLGMRLQGQSLGRSYVEDASVYRIR